MSVVYELGDASMKQNLVDALVTTLTGSGKRKRTVKVKANFDVSYLALSLHTHEFISFFLLLLNLMIAG